MDKVDISLVSAEGNDLKVHGETMMQLELGGKLFDFPVKVVSLGDKSTIMGSDFMEYFDCVLHLKKDILSAQDIDLQLFRLGRSRCARIQLSQKMSIPPKSELILPGQFHKSQLESRSTVRLSRTYRAGH